jgi:hypothetical protein
MKMRNLLFLFTIAILVSCHKPLPDTKWRKGLDQLKETRKKNISTLLRNAQKTILDMGSRLSDTLLYDSLKTIDQHFNNMYSVLESENVPNNKKLQDSLNESISLVDPYLQELLKKDPPSLIDSFQFLSYDKTSVRIRPENIPDQYSSFYRESLLLELLELETILITNKSSRLTEYNFYNNGATKFIVKANKDRIYEGENYHAGIYVVAVLQAPNKKYIIDGKEYLSSYEDIVDYKISPTSTSRNKEKYQKKCVHLSYVLTYLGKDTTLRGEYCYTIEQKCRK